jgi:uncharacterized protein (TIGR03663 family)
MAWCCAPMKRTAAFWFGILAVTLLALVLRTWGLGLRPMHHDEANQAVRTGALLETGIYKYDPEDHHGPSLYYLSAPLVWLQAGRTFSKTDEATFRLIPALFGVALVPLLLLLRGGFSRTALLMAALLTALSPAMVFYSRYFIQEMLLVFFSFGAIVAAWRYFVKPSAGWALVTGAFLGLMFATKETSVLAFVAMAIGLLAVRLAGRGDQGPEPVGGAGLKPGHLVLAALAALGVAGLLFSSFLTNPVGLLDSVRSLGVYLRRGLGETLHRHPWSFYLQVLGYTRPARGPVWTEGLTLVLALVGGVIAWVRPDPAAGDKRLVRFLAVYALALLILYSAIPHKTPWCALSFLHPLIIVAGYGVVAALRAARRAAAQAAIAALVFAGVVHLGWQSVEANFRYYADPRNPYVYAQTSPDFLKLVRRVDEIAQVSPEGRDLFIQVVTDPYNAWPLPWYLRRYSKVGYWGKASDALSTPVPCLVITTPDLEPALAPRLVGRFRGEFFGLRPSVLLLLYTRQDLWERFMANRARKAYCTD